MFYETNYSPQQIKLQMRKYFIVLLIFIPIALIAQSGRFKLEGKIGDLDSPAKVYLVYRSYNGLAIDSMSIHKGKFTFRVFVPCGISTSMM